MEIYIPKTHSGNLRWGYQSVFDDDTRSAGEKTDLHFWLKTADRLAWEGIAIEFYWTIDKYFNIGCVTFRSSVFGTPQRVQIKHFIFMQLSTEYKKVLYSGGEKIAFNICFVIISVISSLSDVMSHKSRSQSLFTLTNFGEKACKGNGAK